MLWTKIRGFVVEKVRPWLRLGSASPRPEPRLDLYNSPFNTENGTGNGSSLYVGSLTDIFAVKDGVPVIKDRTNIFAMKNGVPEVIAKMAEEMRIVWKVDANLGVRMKPVDPEVVLIFKRLAKDEAYRDVESWKALDKKEIEAITETSCLPLVGFGELDWKSAAQIVDVALDIRSNGIDGVSRWTKHIIRVPNNN